MPEVPDGLAIETVWAVEAEYSAEAKERRSAVRAEHLQRIAKLRDEGTIIEAGGFADWSAALLIIRAGDAEAALDIVRNDIYVRSGVWTGIFKVRALGRVVRTDELSPSR